MLAACYDVTTPPHRAPSLSLPDTGSADGASLLRVTATIDTTGVAVDKRTITLATTAGTFTAGSPATATLATDAGGSAVALLRAPTDSTTALVTATSAGVAVSRTVVFRRAMPDRIEVVPSRPTLFAGSADAVPITITLRRTVGVPSAGLQVNFSSDGVFLDLSPRGTFVPATATSDASGVVRTTFSALEPTYRGTVVLHASSPASGVTGDASIQVTGP